MSVRLYVKLPRTELEKEGVEKMFADFGKSVEVKIMKEQKKGQCRGFGFINAPDEEAANEFIAKYNQQTFVYNDEPFKDEEGNEFQLLVEKALPKKQKNKSDKKEVKSKSEDKKAEDKKPDTTASRRGKGKKVKKSRGSSDGSKPTSVTESIQPDPRWATELSKLKELLAAQTTN
jgi:RNA recognition motif-containing protein